MKPSHSIYLLLLVVLSGGCGVGRGIEQWKCNHFGMCHFGVKPTNLPYYPYSSIPGNTAPMTSAPSTAYPPAASIPYVYPGPTSQGCSTCGR